MSGIPTLPPTDSYVLSWTTSNADTCTGTVLRNGWIRKALFGTSNLGINFSNDGAVYEARLTCVSSGGTTTKTAVIGGNGNGDEY